MLRSHSGGGYEIHLRHGAIRSLLSGQAFTSAAPSETAIGRAFGGWPGRLRRRQAAVQTQSKAAARLWLDGTVVAESVAERAQTTSGWCVCDPDRGVLVFDLPSMADAMEVSGRLVAEILLQGEAEIDAGPLCIVGPQRCGSTALLWALDHATRYKGPRPIHRPDSNLLEGYYLRQALQVIGLERMLSPFGSWSPRAIVTGITGVRAGGFPTGIFATAGQESMILDSLARHVSDVYSTAAENCRCWIDKSPGWETVIAAPLFAAFYPRGKVIFLTRSPVPCIASMLRLENRVLPEQPDQKSLEYLGVTTAAWLTTHWVWRRFCRPLLPPDRATEIRFEDLRAARLGVLTDLGRHLNLSLFELSAFRRALRSAPVKAAAEGRDDSWWRRAIRELTRTEVGAWGARPAGREEFNWEDPTMGSLIRMTRENVVTQLAALGMDRIRAMQSATSMLPPMPPGSPEDPYSKLEPLPEHWEPVAPGALLEVMLRSPSVPWSTGTEPAGRIANGAEPAEVGWTRRELIQRYEGRFLSRTHAEGEFLHLNDGRRYSWSAELRSLRRGRAILRFVSNQSEGMLDLIVRRGVVTGFATLSGRSDAIDGIVAQGHVRFTRSILTA